MISSITFCTVHSFTAYRNSEMTFETNFTVSEDDFNYVSSVSHISL